MQPNNDSKIDFQTFVFASADIVRALLLGESIGRLYNIESIEYKWRSRSIGVDQCTSLGLLFQQKTILNWMNEFLYKSHLQTALLNSLNIKYNLSLYSESSKPWAYNKIFPLSCLYSIFLQEEEEFCYQGV